MEIQTTHWPVHGTVLLAQLWFSMLSLFLPSDYIRLFGRNVMWLLICKYKICSMEVTGLAVFWFSLWNILACCFICHAMLWIFRERGTETEHSCPALHNHTYRYGMSRPLTSRNCQSHCWGRFSAALGNTPVLVEMWYVDRNTFSHAGRPRHPRLDGLISWATSGTTYQWSTQNCSSLCMSSVHLVPWQICPLQTHGF